MLFYLMHKNDKIALLNVRIGYDAFSITEVREIYNKKMMPLITYKKRYSKSLEICGDLIDWYRSRYFDVDRENFWAVSNQLSMNYNNRATDIMYAVSFFTYGSSMLDSYWFNPVETLTIDFGEYIPKLTLNPTTWEYVDFRNKNWSDEVGNMFEDSIMLNPYDFKPIRYVNLDSPDIALSGHYTKRWVIINNELYIKKIYPNTEKGIQLCEDQIKRAQYIKNINPELYIEYIQDDKNKNICYCKNFLKENEEFISPFCVLMWNIKGANEDNGVEVIQKNAIKLGCNKKLIKEYNAAIKAVNEYFNIDKNDLNNMGFIIDVKTNKIIKPAPIYGGM